MRITPFQRRTYASVEAVIILSVILSCSSAQRVQPLWETVQDGIEISVQADPRLNLYESKANPLKLVIYQFEAADTYYRYADSEENLSKLLHTADNDPEAINSSKYVDVKDYFIQPSQALTLHLPRFSQTRWVVIVAGYWRPLPAQASRIFAIPLRTEKGFSFVKKPRTTVERLVVRVKLGSTRIEEVSSNNGNG